MEVDVSIIIPTIDGRETSLAQVMAAYDATTRSTYEFIIERNRDCWPAACNAGAELATGRILHFGADDLLPAGDWLTPCVAALERNVLPAPRIWDHVLDGDPRQDGSTFTRVPALTREMVDAIGRWPEIIYYADCWVSDKARTFGWETVLAPGYDFVHLWSQVGRLDGDTEAMDDARREYERLVAAL